VHALSVDITPESLDGTNMGALFDSLAPILVNFLPVAIGIMAAMFGLSFVLRMFKTIAGHTPSSYSEREALSTLPQSASAARLEARKMIAAPNNGPSLVLRVPTGCACPLCAPNAKQAKTIEGMLNPPPMHEWSGWTEYASR
jgi:hypothetical protein